MIVTDQKPVAHIEYLFVNQEVRGRGVGSKFLTDALKFFKKEGRYSGLTLECEDKLLDFYKKFQAIKIETFPSQFQEFEGLFYLMFIPITHQYSDEKEISELAIESLKNVRKGVGLVEDHSEDTKVIWIPTSHISFREVKHDEEETLLEKTTN